VELAGPLRVVFIGGLAPGVTLRVRGSARRPRELMRSAGLPPWERDLLPLVMDADGLAALPGIATRDAPPRSGAPRFWLSWTPESPVRTDGLPGEEAR
jgi:tRNA(Ile)-lysidine synthetase-like protein